MNRELLSSQCLERCPCKQRDPKTWIRELFIIRSRNIPRFQFGVRSALWKLKTNDLKCYPCMLSRAKGVHRYQRLAEQNFFFLLNWEAGKGNTHLLVVPFQNGLGKGSQGSHTILTSIKVREYPLMGGRWGKQWEASWRTWSWVTGLKAYVEKA